MHSEILTYVDRHVCLTVLEKVDTYGRSWVADVWAVVWGERGEVESVWVELQREEASAK